MHARASGLRSTMRPGRLIHLQSLTLLQGIGFLLGKFPQHRIYNLEFACCAIVFENLKIRDNPQKCLII